MTTRPPLSEGTKPAFQLHRDGTRIISSALEGSEPTTLLSQSSSAPERQAISDGAFPSSDVETHTGGPTAAEREANRYHASVEVEAADGSIARMALDTVNGYIFTAIAAAEAARRVLAGDVRPGYQTPVEVFGNDFALTTGQTSISVL